jgi:lipoprotein-releasing system permease protein
MFFLAIRHLFSRKKQTSLTLLGIILGTAAYIAISGMMLGFQNFIIDQLVNNDSHIRIKAREEMLEERTLDHAFFSENTLVR